MSRFSSASLGACEQAAGLNLVRQPRHSFETTRSKQDRKSGFAGILNEEGSELVETALSYGILLTLLVGLLQITLAVYAYHYVSDAAREATRWAMVRGSNCTGLAGCGAGNPDIQAFVQNLGYPGIMASNLATTTHWYTQTMDTNVTPNTVVLSICGTDPTGCNYVGNQVKVQVTYKLSLNIPFVPNAAIAITSTSAMMIAQ
ncbi:MAG: TadE/TadG family type IV pilus assembly protein [Terracidiphilus sp.]|nr:TadE/TadG family type IV pilus assembly protein [Terracidiphilus sp.]